MKQDGFLGVESFAFDHPKASGSLRCDVQTEFMPQREGFALLTAAMRGHAWTLDVEFDLAAGLRQRYAVQLEQRDSRRFASVGSVVR